MATRTTRPWTPDRFAAAQPSRLHRLRTRPSAGRFRYLLWPMLLWAAVLAGATPPDVSRSPGVAAGASQDAAPLLLPLPAPHLPTRPAAPNITAACGAPGIGGARMSIPGCAPDWRSRAALLRWDEHMETPSPALPMPAQMPI